MHLWMNSKYVSKNDYFLVNEFNEKYVSEAIKNKAEKIITQKNTTYDITTIKVDNINSYFKDFYHDITNDIKLIGITGTNGKTTTCYLIYQMLNMIGVKTAYIGTIGFYINGKIMDLKNTTPSIDLLYNLIMEAKEKDCKVVVMEVSSHALKQKRVDGLLFDAIAVTNVTRDHLDYHKNMNDYIKSKKLLTNMLRDKKICILNKKDKYYKQFINKENNNYLIGRDVKIKKVITNLENTILYFKDKKNKKVSLQLVGDFNVYNYLMAYKIVEELGYDTNLIIDKSYLLNEPPGRMQKVIYNKNVIFVDYAHTPDAVLKVLKTVKKLKNSGIITIIGCGGNRDKTKRPIMANIACKYSSYVIFTNDNPRDENEKSIMIDIIKGAKGKYEIIYDRRKAIKKAIELLDNKKILMILGKGHEDYQIIGDKKYYFNDLKTMLEIITNK